MDILTSSAISCDKKYLSPQEWHDLSEELAEKVAKSNFMPSFLITLWRGGCYPGAVMKDFLQQAFDISIDHIALRTTARDINTGIELPGIDVHMVEHVNKVVNKETRLLIVDDVWDSGHTIKAVLETLQMQLGEEKFPLDIRVATIFYKPKYNRIEQTPDYYVISTDAWLIFPHDLFDLNEEEIAAMRPRAAEKINLLKGKMESIRLQ